MAEPAQTVPNAKPAEAAATNPFFPSIFFKESKGVTGFVAARCRAREVVLANLVPFLEGLISSSGSGRFNPS